jgi:hypothetical protein
MKSRELAVAAAIAIAAAAAAAWGCGHTPPKPDPYVASGVASIRSWLDGLPRCPPSKGSVEMASFRQDEATAAVALRGQLTLAASPACTTIACVADTACCNNCFPSWVVVPETADAPRELAIQKSGTDRPLSAVVRDCKLGAVRAQLPSTRVVVSGFLEGGVIIRASMCVLEASSPAVR